MKNIFNKSFLLLASTGVLAASGWFGYGQWEKFEQQKENWSALVRDFQSCDLTVALWRLGKSDLNEANNAALFEYQASKSPLTRMITVGYRDGVIKGLEDVWIDPNVQDSLSVIKSTQNSVNMLRRCDAKIDEGILRTGLSLAYYYLYIGHPNAAELINNLGDRGITDAYVLLGHAYRQGLMASVKDEKLAFAYYLKAANKGSTKGMLNAAALMQSIDLEKSKKYVIAAAEEGSLTAAYMLHDPSGIYRRIQSDELRSENGTKVLYFWSLVFTSLKAAYIKEDVNWTLDKISKSPFIWEENQVFEFDDVPSLPWNGELAPPKSATKAVSHYPDETVKENQSQLEAALDSNSRIQVQDKVKQWMADWNVRKNAKDKGRSFPDSEVEKKPTVIVKKPLKVVA